MLTWVIYGSRVISKRVGLDHVLVGFRCFGLLVKFLVLGFSLKGKIGLGVKCVQAESSGTDLGIFQLLIQGLFLSIS